MTNGTRSGWGVSVTPRPLFNPGNDPVPILQEAGWVPGSIWTGAENLTPTEIRSPDRPDRSQSLYRLSYRFHSSLLSYINPLKAELNPIYYLLALLGAHNVLNVSRIRVNLVITTMLIIRHDVTVIIKMLIRLRVWYLNFLWQNKDYRALKCD
jgi:hypothetical protein